jgi:hypothetical protein
LCCISCCVVQKEKRRREGGCGWPGKVPRSPAAHKRKKRKKPTARYLIDQYGEKGKAIKKKSIGQKKRKEGAECAMRREKQLSIMWNGFSEMRERERKERGEILNEDGREIGWMKEIWKRRERIEKQGGGG